MSLPSQQQFGGILPAFLSQLFGAIKHILECDPFDYSLKERDILWALMGGDHI